MLIYNYDAVTKELLSSEEADQSPLEANIFLLPANATFIKPDGNVDEFKTFCFNPVLNTWSVVPDYRNVNLYSKSDRLYVFATLGKSLDDLNATTIKPTSDYDIWDAITNSWVYSEDLKTIAKKSEVDKNVETLMSEANTKIAILSDAYELGIITQIEKAKLTEWKTYRVLLSRVSEQETYPLTVEYPVKPE